jgi:RNA polymerase sigma-70 factor (ECF subfamily)
MFGVCLRYFKDKDTAEDALQEGFIRVFQKIGTYRGEGSLEGWIRRIIVRTSIEIYRKETRFIAVEEMDASEEHSQAEDALSLLSAEEIISCIQELPSGFRTVFNLYAIEGYSHQEISEMLSISVGTSKSQLSRARDLLAGKIENKNRRIQYGRA